MIAHVGHGGGGALPTLLLLAGMGAIAWAARLQGARPERRRWLPFAVGALGLAAIAGSFLVPDGGDRPDATLTWVRPAPGSVVPADADVEVEVVVAGAPVAATPTAKDGGHLHLYVDGRLQAMPYGTTAVVRLPAGAHRLRAEFVDERHVPYKPPIEVEADVTAAPPS